MMPIVILDRDGVINYDSDEYIKSPDEWRAIPGSLEAIAELNRAGFSVMVVTNQSGIARGLYSFETLEKIHEKLLNELGSFGGSIKDIFFCPHHPDDHCDCRKPKPGMLYQLQKKYSADLTKIFFIGDSIYDIKAAQEVGCTPILVLTGKGKKTLQTYPDLNPVQHFNDLATAVEYILKFTKN